MIIETIDLYEYFGIEKQENNKGKLICYLHENSYQYNETTTRPAIVVMPGGAYRYVSPRESEPIALKYYADGFNAFVLDYSVVPCRFPTQLIEGCMAVAYIRENANKLNVIENKICGIGFSAGGHLVGTMAMLNEDESVKKALREKAKLAKLNAVIFSYAVIDATSYNSNSIEGLCNEDRELMDYCSLNKRVKADTPPAFIWATSNDKAVPVEHSLSLAMSYKKSGIPFEMHIFENGVHGLSLSTKETANKGYEETNVNEDVARWYNMSISFLKRQGFDIIK